MTSTQIAAPSESEAVSVYTQLDALIGPLVAGGGLDVHLLLDCSGSTVGERQHLVEFAETISHQFTQRGSRVQIAGFDENVYPIKDLDGEGQSDLLLHIGCGGTLTESAIAYARTEADKSQAKHKLILIYTDGELCLKSELTRGQIDGALADGLQLVTLGWRSVFSLAGALAQFGGTFLAVKELPSIAEMPALLVRVLEHANGINGPQSKDSVSFTVRDLRS